MVKEIIIIKHARAQKVWKNEVTKVLGIFLVVREHAIHHTSHKDYRWYGIPAAIELELLPKSFLNETDENKIDDYLEKHIVGTTITDKVKCSHDLGKVEKNKSNLQLKIAHLVGAFDSEIVHLDVVKSKTKILGKSIKLVEKRCIESLKGIKLDDGDADFPIFTSSLSSDYLLIGTKGEEDFRISALVEDPKFSIKVLCLGNTGGSIKPDEEAHKIYEHYRKRITDALKELIALY